MTLMIPQIMFRYISSGILGCCHFKTW